VEDVLQTIIAQFGNSPTIVRLIENMNAYVDPSTNIDAFYDLVWNVDTAVGYGLDVWGRIVGVSRVLQIVTVSYFGFTGPDGASGVPWGQGTFYNHEPLTSNYTLTDDAYRILVLAKALKNISNASIESINQIMVNIWGPGGLIPLAGNSYVVDGLDMTLTYTFSEALDPVSAAIVFTSGVLPRPAGVLAKVSAPSADFWSNGGVLMMFVGNGYPTSPSGLPVGGLYSDSLVVSVAGATTPSGSAPPIFFGEISAAGLLAATGANLPNTNPGVVDQLWNNGGVVSISAG
jgi:Protein of unknown function (DUF2612)